MKYDVIDISHHNGVIDFNKVKNDDIKGVIIKAGGSDGAKKYYKDVMFEHNYREAKKAGLLVGAYWFSGSQINCLAKGIQDAIYFENVIAGKEFELPLFMDYEVGDKSNKRGNTDACYGFCTRMESKGYFTGIYGSDSNTFNEMVYKKELARFYWWVAKYSSKEPTNNYGMWQYTSKGKIDGIKGNVDISKVKSDVSSAIIKLGLNGFSRLNS